MEISVIQSHPKQAIYLTNTRPKANKLLKQEGTENFCIVCLTNHQQGWVWRSEVLGSQSPDLGMTICVPANTPTTINNTYKAYVSLEHYFSNGVKHCCLQHFAVRFFFLYKNWIHIFLMNNSHSFLLVFLFTL